MKHYLLTCVSILLSFLCTQSHAGDYVFTVHGGKTYLNGREFLVKGLRCSNALISDETTDELIANLDTFARYGVNTVSVFFMGSRFGDVKGYREDATLNPTYAKLMGRIIEAADKRGMVVLVGCLYWSNSKASGKAGHKPRRTWPLPIRCAGLKSTTIEMSLLTLTTKEWLAKQRVSTIAKWS